MNISLRIQNVCPSSASPVQKVLRVTSIDKLFDARRYPCLSPKAEYNEEKVYSLAVAAARFLFNDRNVVTVGGTDAALMLWEVVDD